MCEKCKDGGNILDGYLETSKGEVFTRLRFDLDNNQFDMQYGVMGKDNSPDEYEWTHSIDISFCPFCGQRLTIETTLSEFTSFIKSGDPEEIGLNMNEIVSFIKNNTVEGSNDPYAINTKLLASYKYRTEIAVIIKINDNIRIIFKDPGHKKLKGL